jgi:uncharacterized damage-inducible protein DinB
MSTREFFAQRLAAELPAFSKVIRALNADQCDYRAHEKNMCSGDLAWQLAQEIGGLVDLFEKGEISMGATERPPLSEIADTFDRNGKLAVERAQSVSEEKWTAPARFLWGGHVAWEATASELAWGFLFDMIHHRGQLSTHIRPTGGKVPAIYGPSGDDSGS